METPHVHLRFELSELLALQQLAWKFNTDIGTLLRIGALALLEADRGGTLKIEKAMQAIDSFIPGGRREN